MSQRPSEGIGERVAKYRKLAGLSARELGEKAGYGLTRGVIANIESGRKTDITVDQLIALSETLGVPPVVLALPLEKPYAFIRTTEGLSQATRKRAYYAMDWFMGLRVLFPELRRDGRTHEDDEQGEASLFAETLIRTIGEHSKEVRHLELARKMLEDGKATESDVHVRELELKDTERTLRQLGVDLKVFKIDE